MSSTKSLFVAFLLIWLFSVIESCKCEGPNQKEKLQFTGIVVTATELPVAKALVKINEEETTSNDDGSFSIKVDANQESFLVSVEKFGYGLYSRTFQGTFAEKRIVLTQGTITEFDPTVDNILTDTNSNNNIMQSALSNLDTSQLFGIVPKVYDHTGTLIDLGYPPGLENIFDYVKEPITRRPGMSVNLRANSLRNTAGNPPPAGTKLRASLSTVDFFNPDGMPGDFIVRYQGDPKQFDRFQKPSIQKGQKMDIIRQERDTTDQRSNNDQKDEANRDRLAFMESFGAGTIEITDGEQSYQLQEGMTAKVTIPVYQIRKNLGETLPLIIPLLHYNEKDGVWDVTGTGRLNETGDAYEGEVGHFSVVNFDLVKAGDSKCFKIRQMLKFNAIDNAAGILTTYRAHIIVPETATSSFDERNREIDESTGCSPADGTGLHGVTRIPNDASYVVAVFSQSGVGSTDTLDIAVINVAPTSIPAETAVTVSSDCSTCDNTLLDCSEATNAANPSASECNTTCWLPDCGIIPFDNSGSTSLKIVGVPMGGGQVKVKWLNDYTTAPQSIRIFAYSTGSCGGTETEIFSVCTGCIGNQCKAGEIIHSTSGTVSYKIVIYNTLDCTGIIPVDDECSSDVVVL